MDIFGIIVGLKNITTTIGGLLGIIGTALVAYGYKEEGEILIGAGVGIVGVFARSANQSSVSLGLEKSPEVAIENEKVKEAMPPTYYDQGGATARHPR